MGYGVLTEPMQAVLRKHVTKRVAWDLGAGDLERSRDLVRLGARHVVAIDRRPMPKVDVLEPIDIIQQQFASIEIPDLIEVAFLAWPVNRPQWEVLPLLDKAQTVIYLGSNTDGSACGWLGLFDHLLHRRLVDHVPHRQNSLVVVSDRLAVGRAPTGEETAAVDGSLMTFEESQQMAELLGETWGASAR